MQEIITQHQVEMLKTMLYFDVFSYPLTREELFANSALSLSTPEYNAQLEDLFRRGFLKHEGDYILTAHAAPETISRRTHGNAGAAKVMPEAYRYSLKIASFPFVEGVCLSGGLSKNYYDRDGDIDYLIMTRPNRLWICRTLLIMRYKMLPGDKKKFWCINYFLGATELVIPEKNAFVATELAHLIPTVNYNFYKDILQHNAWYKQYYPNKTESASDKAKPIPSSVFRKLAESLCAGSFGDWLDNKLLSYTLNRWRKKYPGMAEEDFELQFRSRKNVCKRHTHGFQNKVLNSWKEKIETFEKQFQIRLYA
ncbi:MAG: hypothetical protein JST26_02460 [Bacteroidetes bacterium]|nr:hypothetical protein [Bacteroidota bacterium]